MDPYPAHPPVYNSKAGSKALKSVIVLPPVAATTPILSDNQKDSGEHHSYQILGKSSNQNSGGDNKEGYTASLSSCDFGRI